VIVFRETGVVHRIKYSFSDFSFLLAVLFTHFILDIKQAVLYQVNQLYHISLK